MQDFAACKVPVIAGTKPKLFSREIRKIVLVMKITAFLLLVATLQVSAKGWSQEKINLSFKDASLEQVFNSITAQTGISFFYRPEYVNGKKVTINVNNASLKTVLDLCLKDKKLTYEIVGNTVAIRPAKNEKDNSITYIETMQNVPTYIDVHGRVVNEKGEAVEGVTVRVKGTDNATLTDVNGEFSIATVEPDAVLVFTHVSMEPFEVKVSGKKVLTIALKAKISELSDVTITMNTGYQQISRERATGSFAFIKKDQIDRRISTDIISRLEGIASGLVFYKGVPSGTTELRIRGQNTIFTKATPLIVVDNFPYEGDINNINPNDVENITVLKDAAAASIWGVRAGNGVVVITTKRGKVNQPLKAEAKINYTMGERPDLFYSPNFINSSDFIEVEKKLFDLGFYNSDLAATTYPVISPTVEILAKQKAGLITQAEADTALDGLRNQDIRNDLRRYFYKSSINQQYTINVNGGGSKSAYFFSAGYDKNRGSQVGTNFERFTLNSAQSFFPLKNLEINTNVIYTDIKSISDNIHSQINSGGTSNKSIYPYARLVDDEGDPSFIVKNYRQGFTSTANSKGFLDWNFYPLKDFDLNTNETSSSDIRINSAIKYNLLKSISFEIKGQYEKNKIEYFNLAKQESFYVRNLINSFATVTSGVVSKLDNVPFGGVLNLGNVTSSFANIRGQVNYNNSWVRGTLAALAGVDISEAKSSGNYNTLYGYNDNTGAFTRTTFSQGNQYPSGVFDRLPYNTAVTGTTDRSRSLFANAAYTYANRYTISTSGRIDQSNIFGVKTNQKTVPLWSVGAKWDINKEKFYTFSGLPELSARVTYGYNGNVFRNVTALTTAGYSTNATYTGLPYAFIVNPPNPSLRWEKTSMLNLGVDFSSKRKIVSGSIEYFIKKGKDLIGDQTLASSSGISQIRGNFANMKGQGLDITINTKIIDRVLKWTAGFLFSYANDKVTSYSVSKTPQQLIFNADGASLQISPIVGKPVYGLYSYKWAGLDPANGDPRGYSSDTVSKNYSTLSNPSSMNDIVYNGPARPTIFGGFSSSFSFKRFLLSVNFSYKFGYYFRRNSISYTSLFNQWSGHADYSLRWQNQGDEAHTNVPSMKYPSNSSRESFYLYSETLIEKGDHIRLQDINLSYNFNKIQLQRFKVDQISVFIYANNLGIIWRANKQHIDPDFPRAGYPDPRTYSFGTKISF